MRRYTRNYLIGLFLYSILLEISLFASSHHIQMDPFIQTNVVVILFIGGVVAFVATMWGLIEVWG